VTPDDLHALLASERDVPAAARAEIRDRLAATIGVPPPAAVPRAGLTAKALWTALAVVGVAAGVWWLAHDPDDGAPPPPPPLRSAPAPIVAPAPPPPHDAAPVMPVDEPAPAPAKRPARVDGPSQSALIAQSWRALTRDDAAGALALLEEDRRRHPSGALAEEREALRVRVLRALGHHAEARTAATAFLARYPRSAHRRAVEAALEDAP